MPKDGTPSPPPTTRKPNYKGNITQINTDCANNIYTSRNSYFLLFADFRFQNDIFFIHYHVISAIFMHFLLNSVKNHLFGSENLVVQYKWFYICKGFHGISF